jgi:hypothetical protein
MMSSFSFFRVFRVFRGSDSSLRAIRGCGLLAVLVLSVAARAETGLNGCLYWLDGTAEVWSAQQWEQQVESMRRAGLRQVILTAPAATASRPADSAFSSLDRFMSACRGSDLRVYLSLWANPIWYARWNLDEELNANRAVVDRLAARYGKHPNFAGWYIPHEIYVVWEPHLRYITELYAGLSAMCKQRTPDKRVVLSPFFILDREGYLGYFRFAEPAEYEAFWYDLLRQTQIDIVAAQDSGEHLSCYTMADRRPFLAAMKRACTRAGKSFWINIETGELAVDSYADYERRFGRKTHVNDAKTQPFWRVVPPTRLQTKLKLAHEFTDTTITWGYQEYWDPMRGPAARAAYQAYQVPPTTSRAE